MRDRQLLFLVLSLTLCLVALVILLSQVSNPARALGFTRYVATTGDDSSDCTDPDNPCSTVQHAVDAASDGELIKIARGTYTDVHTLPVPSGYPHPPSLAAIEQVVYLGKTIILKGGYTPDFSEPPNPIANPTTLDAQGQGRVLFISGTISPTLVGLRITGGNPADQGGAFNENDAGGGIYVFSATVTISDSEVFWNTATYGGGGLYLTGSDMVLTGNTINNNIAKYEGGGLWMSESHGVLRDNIVIGNYAGGDSGGGLSLWRSNTLLWRNIIRANTAGSGGGVFLYQSPSTIRGNSIVSNTAFSYGGGLGLHYSNATVEGNTISDNRASGRGGGLLLGHSDAILINNIIAGNQADDKGSGMYIDDSFPRLLHTTIARNTGSSGIALTGVGFSIAMTNSILVSHTIGIEIASGNTASLEATLWGTDTWANGDDWAGDGTILTGTVNVYGDPAFKYPDSGHYRISENSAAKDVGVNAAVNTDIDGQSRPYDSGYDIGADEFHPYFYIHLPLIVHDRP